MSINVNSAIPKENSGLMGTSNYEENLMITVTDVIRQIGIPAHIKGYHYLRKAIILSVNDQKMLENVTKLLYPTVAKDFSTTSTRVERAIRHAIETAWNRGNIDVLTDIFGYTINANKGKPTNSEFIALITDMLQLKMKFGNRKAVTTIS